MKISPNSGKNIQVKQLGQVPVKHSPDSRSSEKFNAYSLNFAGNISSLDVQSKTLAEDKVFSDFLTKTGKVSLAEFEDVALNHPRTLTKCYEICGQERLYATPASTAKFAISLKNYFDDLYGKDNYLVVSLGTSPAPICETMQNIGTKTIFLPVTGLGRLHKVLQDNPIEGTIANNYPNVQALMDYADLKGLKDNLGHVVLLDYENCGYSLKRMEQIFLERGDIEAEKIHKCSVMDALSEILKNQDTTKPWALDAMSVDDLKFDMSLNKSERISNVPHFEVNHNNYDNNFIENDITDLIGPSEDLFKRFDDFSKPNARAWSLCSLNEAKKLLN